MHRFIGVLVEVARRAHDSDPGESPPASLRAKQIRHHAYVQGAAGSADGVVHARIPDQADLRLRRKRAAAGLAASFSAVVVLYQKLVTASGSTSIRCSSIVDDLLASWRCSSWRWGSRGADGPDVFRIAAKPAYLIGERIGFGRSVVKAMPQDAATGEPICDPRRRRRARRRARNSAACAASRDMCNVATIPRPSDRADDAAPRPPRPRREGIRDGLHHDEWTVALGHRRLAIIDLQAVQPLANEDRRRLDLLQRRNLQPSLPAQALTECGHRFATHCDTEAIVHHFEERRTRRPCRTGWNVRLRDLG